jgi:sugar lactone lactonase YvrE
MGLQSIFQLTHHFFVLSRRVFLLLLVSVPLVRSQTQATTAPLNLPSAIAYDAEGNLYIAETRNHVVRKVDSAGDITTIAGTGTQGFSGDGGPASAARLDSPQGLAIDAGDHLYIADTHNQRIRRVDLATGLIATIAGTTAGFSGDNGPAIAARLNLPIALAVDAAGNLYAADAQNYRVRKIDASGIITTVAGDGTQGFSGDNGPATAAAIDSPSGLAVDAAGNLYLSDTHNHRVRKVAIADGIITTIAGTGSPGYSGDSNAAGAAAVALPHGLTLDRAGNLYIADTGNNRIRRIDAVTGAITTVAGNGTQTFSGDSGLAASAALDSPRAVTASPSGLLAVADSANRRIRQLDSQPGSFIHTVAGLGPMVAGKLTLTSALTILYGSGQITASLSSATPATGSVTFSLLDPVTTAGIVPLASNAANFDIGSLAAGAYTLIASYAGDASHASTQSPPLTLRIVPRPLVVTPNSITLLYGQTIPPLTGSISGLLPQDSGRLDASFTASVLSSPSTGVYPISVSIDGAAAKNYALTSSVASLTIKPAPTITSIAVSATSVTSGAPLTLLAHVASTTAGTPAGSVTIMDGGGIIQSLPTSAGTAIFTIRSLTPGSHTLRAVYTGDNNFIASTSSSAAVTVISAPANSADFNLASTGAATQTIPTGGSANFSFAIQIQGAALASPITLAASGLPPLAVASFNPAYLPPGATPNTFTLTIDNPQTTAFRRDSGGSVLLLAFLLFPVTGIAVRLRSGRKLMAGLVFVAAVSTLALLSGCGSRINLGEQSSGSVKTYNITVTGTATSPTGDALQHSTTVKLLVQSSQ